MRQEHNRHLCRQQCGVAAASLHTCQVKVHSRDWLNALQVDQGKDGKLQIQQKDAYIQKLEARLLSKHKGPGSAKETASFSKGNTRTPSSPLLLSATVATHCCVSCW